MSKKQLGPKLASEFLTCEVWAPGWTEGIPAPCPGRKIFVWTLDVREFISDFLNNNNVDGIMTNYPSMLSGMNYTRQQ